MTTGLPKCNGRKPDGIPKYAYKRGMPRSLDNAFIHIFASIHVNKSVVRAEPATNLADVFKRKKARSRNDR